MKKEKYLSIGEFAKMCGVKKDTLFHYDTIGILKPDYTAPNGYRYYSYRQFFTYDIIACLKECKTSLKEIKSYIDNQDTDYFLEILEEKERVLAEEQKKIERMRRVLKNTAEMTKKALALTDSECWVEECEEEHMIISEKLRIREDDMDQMVKAVDQLFLSLEETRLQEEFAMCSIVEREHLNVGDFLEDYYYFRISGPADHEMYRKKPAGTYASVSHMGAYETLPDSYEKLIEYIHKNGYDITGDSYEQEMLNHLAVKDPEKYVLKISIRIGRA